MELQRILDTLRYGELANVYTEDKQDQLVTFINLGLTQLYSKFPILEKQIAIQQYPQISLYKLTREFARTNRDRPTPLIGDDLCEPEEPLKEHHHHHVIHKYILDNPHDPFMGDVLFISSVFDETGHPVPLNDDNNPHSFFTPSFDTLQILTIVGTDTYNQDRYEKEFLFSDEEADETVCSLKQTTFMACMIASFIVNNVVNFCANEITPMIKQLPFFIEYDSNLMYLKESE